MRSRLISCLTLMLSLMLTASARADLKVGDPAPAIKVSKFVKGGPLNSFEPGKVYVMEFWATWCGPCIQAIPHLTEIQEKYREKGVIVMGTSVWERDPAQPKVEPFVKEMGDKMNYIVAMDDRSNGDGVMAETWLTAAGQNGIPASFIVDQTGRIAWIGHPMRIEEILEQVVAGTYDVEKQANIDRELKEFERAFTEAARNQDWDKLISLCDQYASDFPQLASQLMMQKFHIQLTKKRDTPGAYATAEEIVKGNNAMEINGVAWFIATTPDLEPRDMDLALRAANKALELSKSADPTILDTLARVHFVNGDVDQAIEIQTRAVEMASGPVKMQLQEALDEYKAAQK